MTKRKFGENYKQWENRRLSFFILHIYVIYELMVYNHFSIILSFKKENINLI